MKSQVVVQRRRNAWLVWLLLGAFTLSACRQDPEAILFGTDVCHHCKMTLLDHRFGGEIVTRRGKVFKFDSLDCLRTFSHDHRSEVGEGAEVFVLEGSGSGELLKAENARFQLRSDLHAPMGKPIIAVKADSREAASALSWQDVQTRLQP